MKKTSIRLNNRFIAFDKGDYFQSDIDVLEDWKESDIDISKLTNVSDEINSLIQTYDIDSHVNFITSDSKIIQMKSGG